MNENEILDFDKTPKKSIYAKLAVLFAILTAIAVYALFASIPKTIRVGDGLPEPPGYLIILTQFFYVSCIVCTVLSSAKNEPWNMWKIAGVALTIILTFAFAIVFVFSIFTS